jgi:hypothetical protein
MGSSPKLASGSLLWRGAIPSTSSRPSAPLATAAPARWHEVDHRTYAASLGWNQRAGARSPPCRQLRC